MSKKTWRKRLYHCWYKSLKGGLITEEEYKRRVRDTRRGLYDK